jgi:hypothetical protein
MSDDHMTEARLGKQLPARIAVLVVALLIAGYVTGYLTMSDAAIGRGHTVVRIVEKRWQAESYRPAASIESLLCTNQTIQTASREP